MKTRLLLLALLAGAVLWSVLHRNSLDPAALETWIAGFGMAGPLVFMLLYAVATLLFLPGSVITLAGGALFGPLWGTLYNLTGATLGATLAFLVARYLGADWVQRKAAGRTRQVFDGVKREGWRFVALVRLVPLFPFNLLNYALGLTRIPLLHYVLTSYLCMLPGAIAYTYLGYLGREAATGSAGLVQKGLIALGLLAVAAFLPRLLRAPGITIETLRERMRAAQPPLLLDLRSVADFDGELGHIDGARNIPLEDLPQHYRELEPYADEAILLICTTDRRSTKAARLLAANGYTNVQVVKGGMSAWNRNGWPTA